MGFGLERLGVASSNGTAGTHLVPQGAHPDTSDSQTPGNRIDYTQPCQPIRMTNQQKYTEAMVTKPAEFDNSTDSVTKDEKPVHSRGLEAQFQVRWGSGTSCVIGFNRYNFGSRLVEIKT